MAGNGGDEEAVKDDDGASTEQNLKPKKWHQRTDVRILLLLLIVGCVVGLSVGLTVGRNNGNDSDTDSATSSTSDAETATARGDEAPAETADVDVDAISNSEDLTIDTDTPTYSPITTTTSNPTSNPSLSPRVVDNEEEDATSIFPTPWGNSNDNGNGNGAPAGGANPTPSTGTSLPPTIPLTPLIVDRTCEFQISQTVVVSAPSYSVNDSDGDDSNSTTTSTSTTTTTVVEKKLSGGTSSYDGNTALIVSYNVNGTEGGVFALSKKANTATTGTGTDYYWEQSGNAIQTRDFDQLGWDLGIKGGDNSSADTTTSFVIGAPGYAGRDQYIGMDGWYWAGRGRAYVMGRNVGGANEGDGSLWYQEGILEPEVGDDDSDFGSSVDIAECGCLVAVGAWHDRNSRGSVFIFSKDSNNNNNNGWTEIQKLEPVDSRRSQSEHMHGNYGYTVAINDDYLAVKAPYDSYEISYNYKDPNRGVVYVYKRRDDDGTFEEVSKLYTPEGTQVRAHLTDMIFVNDFLLVGTPGRNKVHVFEKTSDGGYRKTAELVPSDEVDPETNNFGISLDSGSSTADDNYVMVGDYGGDVSYLFSYEDGVWKEKAKFDGFNIALSGASIVEHSPKSFGMSDDGQSYEGEVNFYDLVCEEDER